MTKPTLVFDLDGTLIDTAPDLLDSLNHCLALCDLPAADPHDLGRYVGMGGRVMIQRAFEANHKSVSEERLTELLAVFIDHYGGNMPGKSRPYPGAIEAMDRFEAAGWALAICTNKLDMLANRLIGSLGLAERFAANCGADRFAFRKPDPRHLNETILLAGGAPSRAVMVGDSRTDIDTAKAAGIPVIAVDYGYTDRHVGEFEPSRVISHFDEMTIEMAEGLMRAAAA
ncbi:MAG: phosphoglycolate phosphatase [Brucellaceae bacterium]|nr:phosphoglycolate phosphatase [Brucellaceae bacterium]